MTITRLPLIQSHSITDPRERSAIVVGVDLSEANRAAVNFAAHRAAATMRPLKLLLVANDFDVPLPHHSTRRARSDEWQQLKEIAGEVAAEHAELAVRPEMQVGSTVSWLLSRSVEESELVVGRRGLGPFGRMLLGSTSAATASRSRVPVTVVPTDWNLEFHVDAPVTVGLDPYDGSSIAALDYAFRFAELGGVPLRIVYAREPESLRLLTSKTSGPAHRPSKDGPAAVFGVVEPLMCVHPTVRAQLVESKGKPSDVLIGAAADAQLVVVGRLHPDRSGFSLGSVSRAVLHRASTPVAIVPSR
jgi:nucleotide-binding universal stress UspA family protein